MRRGYGYAKSFMNTNSKQNDLRPGSDLQKNEACRIRKSANSANLAGEVDDCQISTDRSVLGRGVELNLRFDFFSACDDRADT
jgi:hypothetical protein